MTILTTTLRKGGMGTASTFHVFGVEISGFKRRITRNAFPSKLTSAYGNAGGGVSLPGFSVKGSAPLYREGRELQDCTNI